MNTTETQRAARATYDFTAAGQFEIHAYHLGHRWEFLVLLGGEPLPDDWWERAGSRARN